MKGSNTYNTTQTAVELLGIANNGIAVAEDLNRQLQFFVVLAKNYLGGQDACLVFDRDGKLMKGTEKINSVDVNCKPIIVSLPNSNTYVVAMLNNNQQPVYHVVNMGLPGYGPIGNMGEVLSANNPLDGNSSITSKHGLHFTGSEDHINGHTMVFDTRYIANPAAAGQGTTDIMAYDFGSSTLTPVANKLYSSYGCGDTRQGQLQISPDGSQLAWWRYTSNLGGFDHRNAEIHTLPLNASKTALSGPVVTRSISAAGSYGNGALDFIKNSADLLYSQRGLYKENNNGTGPAYDRNVWKYSPVNLSSVRINPNTSSPMISYLFGEIKRGSDGNYYIPQMGKANDQIHAYNNANFNSDISLGDTMYKLTSSLPTQVYKIFEDPTASVKEFVRSVGNKAYELKDHLGNVRVVISDVKLFAMTGSTGNYYTDLQFFPEVKNYTDYYAFGMSMPGRSYVNGSGYRYGYQAQETDQELWNGAVSFEYRIEETRIGRFFSADPLAQEFPSNSSYAFAENRVMDGIELEGLEWQATKDKYGNTTDYQWKGFNKDGTAPEGTVPAAALAWSHDGLNGVTIFGENARATSYTANENNMVELPTTSGDGYRANGSGYDIYNKNDVTLKDGTKQKDQWGSPEMIANTFNLAIEYNAFMKKCGKIEFISIGDLSTETGESPRLYSYKAKNPLKNEIRHKSHFGGTQFDWRYANGQGNYINNSYNLFRTQNLISISSRHGFNIVYLSTGLRGNIKTHWGNKVSSAGIFDGFKFGFSGHEDHGHLGKRNNP